MKTAGELFRHSSLSVACMLLLSLTTVWFRPLIPVDETRYLAVAWEMHDSGDFLVSHLNGETYAHKPPLLFWLINLVWSVTGPVEFWGRLVAPAFSAISLVLTVVIARRLWPDRPEIATVAPLLQCTLMLWMVYSPTTMFDSLLTVFAQIAILGVLRLDGGKSVSGVLLTGAGIGLGILSKGPVVLVHVLPVAVSAFLWSSTARHRSLRWCVAIAASIVLGGLIALAWAIPSAVRGGPAYADELLWGQTAGRVVESFAHRHAWWWYLPVLVPSLLPWLLLPSFWSGCRQLRRSSATVFCAIWWLGTLAILSLVSGKQPHYLLPSIPGATLLMAAAITSVPLITRRDLRSSPAEPYCAESCRLF
ncbi:MAG: glycosyltransferase family 39 protein [Planctomycetaceae bacterium]